VSDGLVYSNAAQLGDQAVAALAPVYAFVATYILLRVIGALMHAAGDRARGGAPGST
jgi:hypothetical protein